MSHERHEAHIFICAHDTHFCQQGKEKVDRAWKHVTSDARLDTIAWDGGTTPWSYLSEEAWDRAFQLD